MLTDRSLSDYDQTKKAEYYDADGFAVADSDNRDKLKTPKPLKELEEPSE